jgi:Lhr-like helicase
MHGIVDRLALMMIDEVSCFGRVSALADCQVHILRESRGPTLEVVVSRMKTKGNDVRFVALSATVPNIDDIARWLGQPSEEDKAGGIYENGGEDHGQEEYDYNAYKSFKNMPKAKVFKVRRARFPLSSC